MKLKILNTEKREKEIFKPLERKRVKLYVCGVTPYDYSHIGHGRCYVNFDVLVRVLKFLGYNVDYVRNITDLDDKLLNKAQRELGDLTKYKQIAEKFTLYYQEDMKALNCLIPNREPRVTENAQEIIDFIEKLLEKRNAYILDEDVYFDVRSFKDYGKLSGKKLEDLKQGARIEIDKRKKNPEDFVLWKGNNQGLFWKSPWGFGRPGWHIECSVMANKYLGNTIDIHGGGMDLIFPHHENEIAQSESHNNKPFVKYWVHNAFVKVNKEKMSKSLGNFFTLRLIFEKFDPMVLRFYFLQHQYRTPIDFTLESITGAEVAYKKLLKIFGQNFDTSENLKASKEDMLQYPIIEKMFFCLCDDLNTPKMLGILFENLNEINKSPKTLLLVKLFLDKVLGLSFKKIEKISPQITPQIEDLIQKRNEARKNKDWNTSDKIRDQLQKLGYKVQDKKL